MLVTKRERPTVLYRPPVSWRSRHVVGALGLRPAIAQHSRAEAGLLMRYAAGASTVVELGVAEGGSAAELRSVMAPSGELFLVDPFERGRLGFSPAWIVAHRVVNSIRRGKVGWVRARSDEAVAGWNRPIDFLFIDADHSYERAAGDWRQWTPKVRVGGFVAMHDSILCDWTDSQSGPVRLLAEISESELEWTIVDQADSLTILRRHAARRR
jgi:predicted O-methyltransferase YrrM